MLKPGICHVDRPIVVHGLDREVVLKTPEYQIRLFAGQLAWLTSRNEHALTGIQDSVELLKIVLA